MSLQNGRIWKRLNSRKWKHSVAARLLPANCSLLRNQKETKIIEILLNKLHFFLWQIFILKHHCNNSVNHKCTLNKAFAHRVKHFVFVKMWTKNDYLPSSLISATIIHTAAMMAAKPRRKPTKIQIRAPRASRHPPLNETSPFIWKQIHSAFYFYLILVASQYHIICSRTWAWVTELTITKLIVPITPKMMWSIFVWPEYTEIESMRNHHPVKN